MKITNQDIKDFLMDLKNNVNWANCYDGKIYAKYSKIAEILFPFMKYDYPFDEGRNKKMNQKDIILLVKANV